MVETGLDFSEKGIGHKVLMKEGVCNFCQGIQWIIRYGKIGTNPLTRGCLIENLLISFGKRLLAVTKGGYPPEQSTYTRLIIFSRRNNPLLV